MEIGIKEQIPSFPYEKKDIQKENPQIQIYGQRLYKDQTYYEYLLEFLTVFISPKDLDKDEGFNFKEPDGKVQYFPSPRLGLKRFIFLSRSPQDKRFDVDVKSHNEHLDYLKKDKLEMDEGKISKELLLEILQDLFYGFNAVVRKRSWFAQSLLPIAPQLVFCEAIGRKADRDKPLEGKKIDSEFNFNDRAFMARGGEVYYLHLLQGLNGQPGLKGELERELKNLLNGIPQLSKIANIVQNSWSEYQEYEDEKKADNVHYVKKTCEWIPNNLDVRNRAWLACKELLNLLSSNCHSLNKLNLFASLIILQILRFMCVQAGHILGKKPQSWVIDVKRETKGNLRKQSVISYKETEESIFGAVYQADIETYGEGKNILKVLDDVSNDTNKLFRKLGKELGLVIPPNGKDMRFSINEHIVKVLVLALVPPGGKLLFSTFLEKCYNHFGMIIGQKEAINYFTDESGLDLTEFDQNEKSFQEFLKKCGFLRDLSDATSIVENPFGR